MSSGFYTTYLGMQARQDAMDVVANNLANVNTTGFKTDNPFFSAYQNALDDPQSQMNIDKSTQLERIKTDFSTGSFRSTGREMDVSIEGEGFFVVNTPNGERYTRDGSFTLNANGQLVTEQGYQVIGQGGPITVPPGAVTIDPAGDISVNGQSIGTLRIVKFASNATLAKEGNNVFQQTDSKMQAVAVQYPNLQQGQLEGSNVNAIKEMVTMMKYMREFESLQKVLTSMNNDTNSSQMGRLSS